MNDAERQGTSGTARPARARRGSATARSGRPSRASRTGTVISRIWFQIPLRTSTKFTAASYQPRPSWEPVAGCLAWSSRRARDASRRGPFRPGRRRTARRPRSTPPGAAAAGSRSTTSTADRCRADRAATPSRPSGRRASAASYFRSRSSVTTSRPAVPSGPSTSRTSSTSDRITASAVRGTAVANRRPGRDPLAAEAALGRAVEDELDGDRCRDDGPEAADQRRGRCRAGRSLDAVEQVRAVDQEAVRVRERVAVGGGHRAHRTRQRAPGYDRADGPASSWSTSMASCTAALTPFRASPRCSPIARHVATTSST